jgi:hypothetical protein
MSRSGSSSKGAGKGEIDKALSDVKKFAASYSVQYVGEPTPGINLRHYYDLLRHETGNSITGRITDGHNNPMPYMTVSIEYEGKGYDGRTDEAGNYDIKIPTLELDQNNPKMGILRLYLSYFRDNKNYFNILDSVSGNRLVMVEKNFSLQTEMDKTQDYDYGETSHADTASSSRLTNLRHVGPVYFHTSEIVDFALTQLKANIDYKLPVDVFVAGTDGTYYNRDQSFIHINVSDAAYSSSNRPDNREYHEFCHHILFSQWNGQGLRGPNDTNHDGYINQNTGDSYTEGFAEFCAMACSKYRGEPKPEIYAGFGSFEQNYKAWSMRGYYEEIAIAGILWDLYDENNDRSDTISLPLDKMWDVMKVRRADMYEYYKAFKAAFPDNGNAIDNVFIEHGFFADKHVGNHQRDPEEPFKDLNGNGAYDAGEPFVDYGNISGLGKPWMMYEEGYVIGKATNYERENRTSIVRLPNSYIKVSDTGVTRYKISAHYNDPADGADYEYFSEVTDGKIYVASAPEDLDVTLTIEPDSKDYKAGTPYTFTNKEYLEKYYSTPEEKGFFDTHTFDLKPTGAKQDTDYAPFDSTTKAGEATGALQPEEGTDPGMNNTSLLLGGAGILMILAGLGLLAILIVTVLVLKRKGKK